MKKKAQVVLLPTDNATKLHKRISDGVMQISPRDNNENPLWNPQHLYFVSDDGVEKGDWMLDTNTKELYQAKTDSKSLIKFTYRVVATTNPELWVGYRKDSEYITRTIEGIARIGHNFLAKYVEMCNLKTPITEVLLEYSDKVDMSGYIDSDIIPEKLQLSKNGEVIISPVVEKMYSRNDVISLLKDYRACIITIQEKDIKFLNVFIENNLPL